MWTFNKISLIGLLWSIFLAPLAACTTSLGGYVIEANSQKPLAFVTIVLPETGQVALSDSTGYFEILVTCEGQQNIVLSYIGYARQELTLVLPMDSLLLVELQPSITTLKKNCRECLAGSQFYNVFYDT